MDRDHRVEGYSRNKYGEAGGWIPSQAIGRKMAEGLSQYSVCSINIHSCLTGPH